MVLTKGAKNQDLALEFMDFWLSTEIQTSLPRSWSTARPTRRSRSRRTAETLTYGEETAGA